MEHSLSVMTWIVVALPIPVIMLLALASYLGHQNSRRR